jgi:hypothetical protein
VVTAVTLERLCITVPKTIPAQTRRPRAMKTIFLVLISAFYSKFQTHGGSFWHLEELYDPTLPQVP